MKRILIIITSLLITTTIFSQEKYKQDICNWTTVSASYSVIPQLNFSLTTEIRLKDNLSSFDMSRNKLNIKYSPIKYFNIAGGYTLFVKSENYIFHRLELDLTGQYNFGNLNLSLRERIESNFHPDKNLTNLRSQIGIAYKIDKTGFRPYLQVEFYNPLNYKSNYTVNRMRYTLGSSYTLKKQHKFNLYLKIQDIKGTKNLQYIIGIGYACKIK